MTEDRVTYDEPSPDVDEIVVYDAVAHLEMSSHSSGYLHVQSPRREVFARIYARPTSRRERRQMIRDQDDTLLDHLRTTIPILHRRNMRTIWSIPVWKRPAAAVREWCEALSSARAVLVVRVEEDTHCGGPEATT